MTWASKVPSLLILMVAAAMCVAPLLTVGRTAAAAAALQQRMEQAGARRLLVIDSGRQGFVNDRTLGIVRELSTTQTATALAAPLDVVNGVIGRGGTRVPLWPVLGPIQTPANLVQGRWPAEGEVVVSTAAMASLGLESPAGFLASSDGLRQWAIVGSFIPASGFEDLATGALTRSGPHDVGRELRVTLTSIAAAGATTTSVLAILDPPDSRGVYVESPTTSAQTARDLNAQVAGYGRTMLLMILAAGGFFVAAVVLADVLVRRRDLGRRRTLGITRMDLTLLVAVRARLVAILGVALGCSIGWVVNALAGTPVPLAFTCAIGVLAVLAASATALAPAAYAAHRDPVVVLRTP